MPKQRRNNLPAPTPYSSDPEMKRKIELLRKVRVRRDGLMLNIRAVLKGDANKSYKWVNLKPERQLYYQALGWEKVVNPMDILTGKPDDSVLTHFLQPDGTHVCADVILYHIDKEMDEAYQADAVLKGIEAIEGHVGQFEQFAATLGAPVEGEGVTNR